MPQPDYENDLVFPPQPVFSLSGKNLTDDWKAEKLKSGWYYTLMTNDEITPNLWFDDEWDNFRGNVVEVLAPCDYEELQELEEKVEDLKKDLKSALWYQGVQNEEINKLRNLLKDCQKYLYPSIESDRVIDCEGRDLLISIEEVLR